MLALTPEPVTRAWDLRDLRETPPPDSTPGVVHAVYAEICADLDGGGSATMIVAIHGQKMEVVNRPSAGPARGIPVMLAIQRR